MASSSFRQHSLISTVLPVVLPVVSPVPSGMGEVRETYRKLALCLEYVDQAVRSIEAPYERAALVVIEEDLNVLLEECEDVLVVGGAQGNELNSLSSRSYTVLEELRSIFQNRSSSH